MVSSPVGRRSEFSTPPVPLFPSFKATFVQYLSSYTWPAHHL